MNTAILELFINDNGDGVLCTAVPAGTDPREPQNVIASACLAVSLDAPDELYDKLDEQAQKQSVHSVLGQLSKLGYKRIIVSKNSDVPYWMPSMLKKWTGVTA